MKCMDMVDFSDFRKNFLINFTYNVQGIEKDCYYQSQGRFRFRVRVRVDSELLCDQRCQNFQDVLPLLHQAFSVYCTRALQRLQFTQVRLYAIIYMVSWQLNHPSEIDHLIGVYACDIEINCSQQCLIQHELITNDSLSCVNLCSDANGLNFG